MGKDFTNINAADDVRTSSEKMCQHNPSRHSNWSLRTWDYFRHGSDLFNHEAYTAVCSRCRECLQAPEAVWRGRFIGKVVALMSVHASILLTWLYHNSVGHSATYYNVPQGIGADVFAVGALAMLAAILVGCWLVPRAIVSLVMALGKWTAADLQGVKMVDYLAERRMYTKQHKRREFYCFIILLCVTSWVLVRSLKVLKILKILL